MYHFKAPVLYTRLGKGKRCAEKRGDGLYSPLPTKYSATQDANEQESEGQTSNKKVRRIGEDVNRLCPNVYKLLDCINTDELTEEFFVLSAYAYQLKSLGSIIGQFSAEVGGQFVSENFEKLI